ncbi:MAG: formyltransferase family protein [Candidatus Levybacteria bacterium]|nr:formyltransferase family protein [Candidatus Levybacteria bacterium]
MVERNAFLVSGGGTTMLEMIKASQAGETPGFEPAVVIASTPESGAIQKALLVGVPVEIVNPETYRGDNRRIDQHGYYQGLRDATDKHGATVFTQNGHLPLTPEEYIEYMNSIGQGGFNQHPGRVPDFGGKGMYGRRVHAATLLFKRLTKSPDMWTEPIVQRVHREFDKGVVVGSERVEILPGDTVDELQQRVLPVEHALNIRLAQDIGVGTMIETPFHSMLLPGEDVFLDSAKKAAILLYPHG